MTLVFCSKTVLIKSDDQNTGEKLGKNDDHHHDDDDSDDANY